jgi:23S rRNA (guanosine2251-2'-O)-methyltransferase
MSLILRNPHSVLAVLETRPKDINEIVIPPKSLTEGWERVTRVAQSHSVKIVQQVKATRSTLPVRGTADEESSRMGGAQATVRERQSVPVEKLFENARERNSGHGLWLALDCLQDPHNVGAIFRAAAFFGVQGILLTQERSAPLTSTVYDVASGGVEYVPFSSQTNLQQGLEIAKNLGLWVLGSSEHAESSISSIQSDRPWLLILGNEERGMRRLTEENCDVLCRIPPQGKVSSLNVSVAAGILISKLSGSMNQ